MPTVDTAIAFFTSAEKPCRFDSLPANPVDRRYLQ